MNLKKIDVLVQICIFRWSLFQAAQSITPNIIMFLPRNVDINQVAELSWLSSPPLDVEVLFSPITTYSSSSVELILSMLSLL